MFKMVDLGFAEACEPWQVASNQFPSKIGGKPAWLSLANIPTAEHLRCSICKQVMAFLCQVYAPFEDPANFHRTLFIFICRNVKCNVRNCNGNVRVLRNSLRRVNSFFPAEPPEMHDVGFNLKDVVNLCLVCGCLATKRCSTCQLALYCCREHQLLDWKYGHKSECPRFTLDFNRGSPWLWPEYEINVEYEESVAEERRMQNTQSLDKFAALRIEQDAEAPKTDRPSNDMDLSTEELDAYCSHVKEDKAFESFRSAVSELPDQVLRYKRGGNPLWIAANPKPSMIPACEHCGGRRQFEFQIMPQMLSILEENELDWGVLVVYSCIQSCNVGNAYVTEYIFKQDVAMDESNSTQQLNGFTDDD